MRTLVLGGALLLLASAGAAAEEVGAIDPDRPDVTDSARTVGRGVVQLEGGVEYARTSVAAARAERRLALQASLRIGLTDRLEARLDGEPFVRLRGEEDATDHGDLTLGVKYRFLDAVEGQWWPALGVLPFVKVPVAPAPIGSETPDFGLLGLASFDLPWELGLDVNVGVAAVGQLRPSGYLVQALASASLSRDVAEGLSVFGEVFFESRGEREGRDTLGVDAGVVWRVAHRVALDAAAGTSLAGHAPDYFVRAGVSVRFGR